MCAMLADCRREGAHLSLAMLRRRTSRCRFWQRLLSHRMASAWCSTTAPVPLSASPGQPQRKMSVFLEKDFICYNGQIPGKCSHRRMVSRRNVDKPCCLSPSYSDCSAPLLEPGRHYNIAALHDVEGRHIKVICIMHTRGLRTCGKGLG